MTKERCPRTCVRSKTISRVSVILVAAACLGPAAPVAAQTDPPAVPRTFSLASRDGQLSVNWIEVPGADSYDVRWKSGTQAYSSSRLAEDIEGNTYTIEGLTNGREYTVQVRATNAGNSAWAPERKRTPSVAPDPPVLRLTSGNGSIAVSWDAVPTATSYILVWFQVGDTDNTDEIEAITTTSYTIESLNPGRYMVAGWAKNTHGHQSNQSTAVVGAPWPIVTVADASAIEGSAVEFTVTLSHAFFESVTVRYSTSDGTATAAGADYTAVTDGTLTFNANDTEETISIATGDDLVKEVDETFTERGKPHRTRHVERPAGGDEDGDGARRCRATGPAHPEARWACRWYRPVAQRPVAGGDGRAGRDAEMPRPAQPPGPTVWALGGIGRGAIPPRDHCT